MSECSAAFAPFASFLQSLPRSKSLSVTPRGTSAAAAAARNRQTASYSPPSLPPSLAVVRDGREKKRCSDSDSFLPSLRLFRRSTAAADGRRKENEVLLFLIYFRFVCCFLRRCRHREREWFIHSFSGGNGIPFRRRRRWQRRSLTNREQERETETQSRKRGRRERETRRER